MLDIKESYEMLDIKESFEMLDIKDLKLLVALWCHCYAHNMSSAATRAFKLGCQAGYAEPV